MNAFGEFPSVLNLANDPMIRRFGPAAVGGIGNARSLAERYAACLERESGRQLLSTSTVATMTQIHASGRDLVLDVDNRSDSFQNADERLDYGGPWAFGHDGAGGSIGFADPVQGLALGTSESHTARWRRGPTRLRPRPIHPRSTHNCSLSSCWTDTPEAASTRDRCHDVPTRRGWHPEARRTPGTTMRRTVEPGGPMDGPAEAMRVVRVEKHCRGGCRVSNRGGTTAPTNGITCGPSASSHANSTCWIEAPRDSGMAPPSQDHQSGPGRPRLEHRRERQPAPACDKGCSAPGDSGRWESPGGGRIRPCRIGRASTTGTLPSCLGISAYGVVAINGQLLRYCVMPDRLVIGHRNWL